MAVSSYGASVALQNNSGSAAATGAPTGSVFLFASGAVGSAKLYLNQEGSTDDLEIGGDLKIAGDSGTGTVSLGSGQTFTIAGGTGLDTSVSNQTVTFSMDLNELSAAAVAVDADSIAIIDADDSNASKKESIADLMTAVAGDGLAASSGVLAVGVDDATIELNSDALRIKDGGVDADALASSVAGNGLAGGGGTALSLDLNELSAAAVAVGADSIAIIDADDNGSKKESIADLATAMAGDGLAASSGVFAVQVGTNKGLALTSDALEITGSAVAAADIAVGTDSFMFFDADGSVKEESFADLATAMAGNGLAASSGVLAVGVDDATLELNSDALRIKDGGVDADALASSVAGNGLAGGAGTALSLDLNELSAAAVAVGADSIAIIDADDNSSKKESIADLATAMAGDGLAASSGVFAVQVGTNKGLALTSDALEITGSAVAAADIAVGTDTFMFFDADGSVKEESIADLATAQAGDGLAASSGVLAVQVDDSSLEINSDSLRVKASGITSAMIADGAIVNADINASAAIAATKLDFNVDLGGNVQFGTQSDDTVAFGGPIKVGGNAIADSAGNAVIAFDGSGNGGFNANMTVGGGYGSSCVTITTAGAINADGALTIGADGAGVNFTAHGGAANEVMRYDAARHVLQFVDGSSATMLTIGGDAASEFAVDVANGSDNKNKMRAAAFVTYSDESLKSDVASMSSTALDTVMSLEGVEFTWKDSGERDFGFIAQDVQSVLPKAVHTADDGVQGVDYSRLTSVLVEAVKAQQVQIEELKALLKK